MKYQYKPGDTWNRLTLIKKIAHPTRTNVWEAQCTCGNKITAYAYNIRIGATKSCGCLKIEKFKLMLNTQIITPCRKYPPVISSARRVWMSGYHEDGCDFDTFYRLSQLPCDYCGREPYRTYNVSNGDSSKYGDKYQKDNGDFTYNGLDRVDSSKGHTIENMVPCCWDCNMAKGPTTREEFIKHIKRMYQHIVSYSEL